MVNKNQSWAKNREEHSSRGDCKRKGFQAGPSREDSRNGKEAHIVGAGRSRSHGSS